ncbi:hypothetical protein J4573_51415 [Actinomadura barringtoniae]|uniref:Uncharacterized protein n=1 Tax=Actinomadura barringtoniae TaxID=1427535 RepID=A0A939PVH6_9ACTN|nr:hypothetical protein [Actinomadura barringtoniae]MBO2455566.1 hypothetical protein [Actinomadura barringtoniae]
MSSRFADRPADLVPQTMRDLLNADETPCKNGARRKRSKRTMTLRRVT